MTTVHIRATALITTMLVVGGPTLGWTQVTENSSESPAAAFARRVEAYVQLRKGVETPLRPFSPPRGAVSIVFERQRLASAIRDARRQAQPGSVFTPSVALMFRDAIAAALTPAERLLLIGVEDAVLEPPVPIVNEPPDLFWMADAPAALLPQLPELPSGIEYRFVGNTLILWDAHADIVIDVLPNAVR